MVKPPILFQSIDGEYFWAFFGQDYIFNNSYPASFTIDSHSFNCSEQHFLWQRALYFGDMNVADQILASKSPAEQKIIGQWTKNVSNVSVDDWEQKKDRAMYNSVWQKFAQNAELSNVLLSTRQIPIVWASLWDYYWSIAVPNYEEEILKDRSKWKGGNKLGDVLALVRHELELFYLDLGWDLPTIMRIEGQ